LSLRETLANMSQSSRYSVKPNQPGVLGQKLGVLGLQHLGLRLLGQHGLLRLRAGSRSGPLLAGPHMNGPGPGVQQGGPRPKCRWQRKDRRGDVSDVKSKKRGERYHSNVVSGCLSPCSLISYFLECSKFHLSIQVLIITSNNISEQG